MKKGKSRSPLKLSKADFRLFWLVCYLPADTDSQGCVSIYFTLYYRGIAGTSEPPE